MLGDMVILPNGIVVALHSTSVHEQVKKKKNKMCEYGLKQPRNKDFPVLFRCLAPIFHVLH